MARRSRSPRTLRLVGRELGNVLRYGRRGPLVAQRIWIDPSECRTSTSRFGPLDSARVLGGSWDRDVHLTGDRWDIRACEEHWGNSLSWADTGAYEQVMRGIEEEGGRKDGCRTLADVEERYARLDGLFAAVQREGRLRDRSELPGMSFREWGGVLVHIGSEGQPVFGRHGCHRMAIARVIGLPVIPAQVGVVHPGGLGRWPAIVSPPFARTR
jgi:hypothetical protein